MPFEVSVIAPPRRENSFLEFTRCQTREGHDPPMPLARVGPPRLQHDPLPPRGWGTGRGERSRFPVPRCPGSSGRTRHPTHTPWPPGPPSPAKGCKGGRRRRGQSPGPESDHHRGQPPVLEPGRRRGQPPGLEPSRRRGQLPGLERGHRGQLPVSEPDRRRRRGQLPCLEPGRRRRLLPRPRRAGGRAPRFPRRRGSRLERAAGRGRAADTLSGEDGGCGKPTQRDGRSLGPAGPSPPRAAAAAPDRAAAASPEPAAPPGRGPVPPIRPLRRRQPPPRPTPPFPLMAHAG